MQHRKNAASRLLDSVKRNWRLVATGGVATAAILTLAASTATAAQMITSGDIKNQTIRSADVSANGVGSSELRGAGDERGAAVNSHHMREGAVKSYQVRDGSVHEKDLSEGVRGKLNDDATGTPHPAGLPGYEVIGFGDWAKSEPGTYTVKAHCFNSGGDDPRKVAVSGGLRPTGGEVTMHGSWPTDTERVGDDPNGEHGLWQATSWTVKFTIPEGSEATVQPYVLCASVN